MNRKISIIVIILILLIGPVIYSFISIFNLYNSPRILIVPHQNAVNELRMSLFQSSFRENKFIKRIILIGPDHFSSSKKSIRYIDKDWNIPDSKVYFDDNSEISIFLKENYENNKMLAHDHAIYNLLDPINKNLPNAKIIPILIGEKVQFDELDNLISHLGSNCGYDCIIIFSVDFSHYLPYSIADIHDIYSIKTLFSKNSDDAKNLEVDSPQSLYVAMEVAKRWNLNFNLFANTNSSKIMDSPLSESTSHVLGYYSKKTSRDKDKYARKDTFIYYNGNPEFSIDRYFYGTEKIISNYVDSWEIGTFRFEDTNNNFEILCNEEKNIIKIPKKVILTAFTEQNKLKFILAPPLSSEEKSKLPNCVKYDSSSNSFMIN